MQVQGSIYPQYCLRITAQPSLLDITTFVSYLEHRSVWYIFSEENPDSNKHWHFVFSTSTTRQSLVAKIKTLSPVRGNKLYSLTLCRDTVKAIAYVLKDSNFLTYQLPDGYLEEAQAYDLTVKKDLKPGNKLKLYLQLMLEVETGSHGNSSIAEILQPVVQYMITNNLMIKSHYLMALWDTYHARHHPMLFLRRLERKILSFT